MFKTQDASQRHLLLCTWVLNIGLSLALLAIATGLLYVTIVAYLGKSEDLLLIYHYAPINVIVITVCATILAIASILGIVSLLQQSLNGLLTATVILFLVLMGSIDYTIWRAFKEDYTEHGAVFRQLKTEIQHYNRHQEIIDILQTKLSCCGAKDSKDWTNVIPPSCCSPSQSDTCDSTNPLFHNKGCMHELKIFMSHYNWMILIGLGFLSSLELVVICLSYVACRVIRNKRQKVQNVEVVTKIPRIPYVAPTVTEEPRQEQPPQEKAQTDEPVKQEEPKQEALPEEEPK